jgi:hypothetical protein
MPQKAGREAYLQVIVINSFTEESRGRGLDHPLANRLLSLSLRTTWATVRFGPLQKFCPGSPRQYLGTQRVCFEPDSSMLNEAAQLTERAAAILLGLSLADLRWFSRRAGLGQIQSGVGDGKMVFTYDELAKLSAISTPSAD